jgi:hypothetical protein
MPRKRDRSIGCTVAEASDGRSDIPVFSLPWSPHSLCSRGLRYYGDRSADLPGRRFGCLALVAKIFLFPPDPNHFYNPRHPVPIRGALAIVTNVGAGCGGRGSVGHARDRRAGFDP